MLETVIRNIWKKKKLMDLGDPRHEEIRIAVLFPGGFMRNIYQAAEVWGFHHLGLRGVFNSFTGISSGAGPPTYFLGGPRNMSIGTSIFFEDCISKEFIDYRRVRRIVDGDYLYRVLRQKLADEETIRESSTDLLYAMTDLETKECVFVDAKKARPNLTEALFSSASFPGTTSQPVLVNGKEYFDGGITTILPIKEICQRTNPTDILVCGNKPEGYLNYNTDLDNLLIKIFLARHGPKELIKYRDRIWRENQEFVRAQREINIGFLLPPDCGIGFMTRNRPKLERAFQSTAAHTMNLFNQYKPTD